MCLILSIFVLIPSISFRAFIGNENITRGEILRSYEGFCVEEKEIFF